MHSCNDAPKQFWQVSEQSSLRNSGTSRSLVNFWPKIDLAGVIFPTRTPRQWKVLCATLVPLYPEASLCWYKKPEVHRAQQLATTLVHFDTAVACALAFVIMACATISSASVSAAIKSARISAPASRQHVCIFARPASKPVACRLQSNSRVVIARGGYGNNCWNAGDCRPAYNQRQWRSGPNMQRSFEKWAEQATNNMWFPVDVEETAEQYTFVADVPGLGKNDIKV